MFAFLFDENHADLEPIFGPQCAAKIIGEIEKFEPIPVTRLLTGSLLHDSLCYRLDEVTHQSALSPESFFGGTQGHRMLPDYDARKAIICDLAETLSGFPSRFSEQDLLGCLASKHIWVVGTPDLLEHHVRSIDAALQRFGPYLGMVVFDCYNPVHRQLFLLSLFNDKVIGSSGLLVRLDCETEPDEALAPEYESKNGFRFLEYEEFERLAPQLIIPKTNSVRGDLSAMRAIGKDPGHRAKVARALIHLDRKGPGHDFVFSAQKPSDGIEIAVDPRKLTEYLLNLDHPEGKSKAAFFIDALGIEKEDWRYLADQFVQAARMTDLYRLKLSPYGAGHGALALVTGRNGRQAVLETAWQLAENGPAKFVTAYPADEKLAASLIPVVGRVPPPKLSGAERWNAIHQLAHSAGEIAGSSVTPPPLVLEKYGTIWEGECGFGWISLADGRKSFAKWLVAQKHSLGFRPGVRVYSPLPTQSIVRHRAYAEAYAEVLRSNGIECEVGSRLD